MTMTKTGHSASAPSEANYGDYFSFEVEEIERYKKLFLVELQWRYGCENSMLKSLGFIGV